MVTHNEKEDIYFSKLTDRELLDEIQKRLVALSFEEDSTNRGIIRDRVYEDIHEMYLRLWCANAQCSNLKKFTIPITKEEA